MLWTISFKEASRKIAVIGGTQHFWDTDYNFFFKISLQRLVVASDQNHSSDLKLCYKKKVTDLTFQHVQINNTVTKKGLNSAFVSGDSRQYNEA